MIVYGNIQEKVTIDEFGNGIFKCSEGSVSVWIMKNNMYNL